MKYLMLSSLCLTMGIVVGCNSHQKHADHAASASADTTKVMCPVEKDHEADSKVTYLYNGKSYSFCCKECIDDFKKDPQKYGAK
jgi:YHS domain-containing protein